MFVFVFISPLVKPRASDFRLTCFFFILQLKLWQGSTTLQAKHSDIAQCSQSSMSKEYVYISLQKTRTDGSGIYYNAVLHSSSIPLPEWLFNVAETNKLRS